MFSIHFNTLNHGGSLEALFVISALAENHFKIIEVWFGAG